MLATIDNFMVAKRGLGLALSEDATFPSAGCLPAENLCVCIADGATESFLAKLWAEHLVLNLGTSPKGLFSVWQNALTDWRIAVNTYSQSRELAGRPIQWYEEPGLARGGYGTVLSLRFGRSSVVNSERRFFGWGIGDCCCFQVRGERTISLFPFSAPDQFDNTPELLFSADSLSVLKEKRRGLAGRFLPNDTFFLMTDAIACWTLETIRDHGPPWNVFRSFSSEDSDGFSSWVDDEKARGRLRDDDVSLVRVSFRDDESQFS